MGNKLLRCLLNWKNFGKKIKPPLRIYAEFESIIVPENNGKHNLKESYTNIYQKHVACIYGYKLICVDDKFSKPFKSYLNEDAVYNFISSMIKGSKYCSDVMKKHFNKELVMTKKIMEILGTLLNVGSVIMITLMLMLK